MTFVEEFTEWVNGKHLERDIAGTANVLGISARTVENWLNGRALPPLIVQDAVLAKLDGWSRA